MELWAMDGRFKLLLPEQESEGDEMGYESKDVKTLPCGFTLVTVVEDGYIATKVHLTDEDSPCHFVEFRTRLEEFRGPAVLSTTFQCGGWCNLFECTKPEVDMLGGFSEITGINGFWSEPSNVMCG
jgi:hypothetical protein